MQCKLKYSIICATRLRTFAPVSQDKCPFNTAGSRLGGGHWRQVIWSEFFRLLARFFQVTWVLLTWLSFEQYKQCTYNVTLWRVRITIVTTETQQCVMCVCCLRTCHCQLYKNIECCTTMLLCRRKNDTYFGLHIKCPMLHWHKRMFVARRF